MTREQVQAKKDNWKYRRFAFFAQESVFSLLLGYLTIYGQDGNSVQLAIAGALPFAMVGALMAYIGGPIADDWLQLRKTT